MSANTKIVVLRMKEIIYTAIFAVMAVVLVALFFFMFKKDKAPAPEIPVAQASYIPGVYSCALTLGKEQVNVEVTVDSNSINSIAIKSLDESVAAMYPLVEPTMQKLTEQILKSQSLDSITYQDEEKYTALVLLRAVETAVNKAAVQQ